MNRDKLQRLVFGAPVSPAWLPNSVGPSGPVDILPGETGRELSVTMPDGVSSGIDSSAWWIEASASADHLCIVHQGHRPAFDDSGVGDAARALLAADCDVLAMNMWARGGQVSELDHNEIWMSPAHPPLYYFFWPVVTAVNWALANKNYTRVSMAGLSGGGWTTTVYAALDDRIGASVEVSGSLPADLRMPGFVGHFEAAFLERYVKTEDVYLMGADALGRGRLQILNRADPCCFSRYGALTGAYGDPYGAITRQLDSQAAGPIRFHEIDDPSHMITADALDWILRWLDLPGAAFLSDVHSPGFSKTGAWSHWAKRGYGGAFWYASPGPSVATFRFGMLPAGTYDVELWFKAQAGRATNAAWSVLEGALVVASGTVDQSAGNLFAGVSLGSVVLAGTADAIFTLSAAGADGLIIADAVKLIKQ